MKWKFFIGACILAVGLLLKTSAPLVTIVAGIALAGFMNWLKLRNAASAMPTGNRKRGNKS